MVATLPVSYTSVNYVYQTVPEIGSISYVTSATIAQIAGMAEAVMNAKLSNLYSIPITVEVPVLTTIATDLTIYRFFTRKPLTGEQSKSNPWFDRFKESSDLLDKIAAGDISLIGVDGSVIDISSGAPTFYSNTMNYEPMFDEGNVESWEQDSTKQEDIADKHS